MENKLHDFIKQNEFDVHEPHSGHLERFERKLNATKPQKKFSWKWMSVAAAVILSIGFGLGSINQQNQYDLANVSPKMAEAQDFFITAIHTEMISLEKNRNLETEDIVEDALDQIEDLGWGIFGTINRWVFLPIFDMLQGFMGNYGLIIILMTIVVRILMSPLVYKSYVSSAKMKVIRPELNEVAKRFPGKDNAMKRQQETMAIQRKAGVSMMAGCIPAILQMPVFFALFKFFPSNLDLRQESFLWAGDLSSYDTIFTLPFEIPFYGDHVSLFPILASIAIFFYMKMNQSQQMNMQPPAQEGMPDMSKLMKYMIYFSPIMMLFFFNNYASSLSLYYFISNLLTITIMFVIKNYVIDEAKIHAQIEENKKRPEKKKSKFRQRLDDAMKQAQEQQAKKK